MKFFVAFFLAVLALASAEDCSDENVEQRMETCGTTLLGALSDDKSETEICSELDSALECMKSLLKDCGDAEDKELEDALVELQKLIKFTCGEDDKDFSESEKCVYENVDHILSCIVDVPEEAVPVLLESGITDDNSLQCLLYAAMTECFVEKTEEKCGEEAAKEAREELEDAPQDVTDACEAALTGDLENIEELINSVRK